jgi:hypothetical protein
MKTKKNQKTAFLTAFLAVAFSLSSIFVTGKILASDRGASVSDLRSNANSSSSSKASVANSDSSQSRSAEKDKAEKEEELKPEIEVEIKSESDDEKGITGTESKKQDESEDKKEETEKEVEEKKTAIIESKVESAEGVEYHVVREGSVEPKIYLGTGQKSAEDGSKETSEEKKETWSLDYDFSNIPQGNYELYAEVKNKYGTYSSEGVPISVYNQANENAVQVIERLGSEDGGDKFQYVVNVMNKGNAVASKKFTEITEQEDEIRNDTDLAEDEKQTKLQELEKEKEEVKNQFAFRNQIEEIYKKKDQNDLTEDEIKTVQEIEEILSIDSDGDGLPDHEELRIGTDPFSADTDGDGYLDGDEVANGYDPLTPASEEGVDKIVFEEPKNKGIENGLYRVEEVKIKKEKKSENGVEVDKNLLEITGKALPNSFITLYVYSSPLVVTVKTDEDGNWSYLLDKELEDGDHQVYAAVTDNTGKITSKSKALAFVKTAQAITANSEEQAVLNDTLSPIDQSRTKLMFFVILISIFSLISAIASIILLYRNHRDNLNS